MPYIKCTDPSEEGNYIVLEKGMIGIWRKIDGESRLLTPLTQISTIKLQSGEFSVLHGRYKEAPSVFIHPSNLTVYNGDAVATDQYIELTAPTVSLIEDGEYQASGHHSSLKSLAATDKFLPLNYSYRNITQNTSGTNKTFDPIYIPGITGATASIHVIFCQLDGRNSGSQYEYFKSSATFKIGISETEDGTITWGTPSSYTCSDGKAFNLTASVTGSGNYLWINIVASSLSGTFVSTYYRGVPFPYYEYYQVTNCIYTAGSDELNSDGIFDCVVVGR